MFVKISSYKLQEICKNIHSTSIISYLLSRLACYIYRIIPPILREVSFCVLMLTGYFGQDNDIYSGREALKVHFLGGRSNHVTSLSYGMNQGSIRFHSINLFIFSFPYFRTLGTMFNISVRGVKMGKLMIP